MGLDIILSKGKQELKRNNTKKKNISCMWKTNITLNPPSFKRGGGAQVQKTSIKILA